MLKIYSPPVPQVLRRLLAQVEPHLAERCSELPSTAKEVKVKKESGNDLKRQTSKTEKVLIL